MAEPQNALYPQVTGVNRLLDWVAQKLNPDWFPTSGRTLLRTVQGDRSPITEANFSPEEIKAIRELVMQKGGDSGVVRYSDYDRLMRKKMGQGESVASISPSMFSMIDPLGNIQTTLGQFRYVRGADGSLQVLDTYDFNPPPKGISQEVRTGEYGATGPYALIRDYAGEKVPPGYGRQVRLNLGK